MPKPQLVGLEVPARLADNPTAAGFWETHAAALTAAGRLGPAQADAFALLCELHADCVLLAAQVRAEGWITATDKGQAASPVARLLRDSRRDWVSLAREFGMTAASDARLPIEDDDGKDADEEDALLRKLSVRGA